MAEPLKALNLKRWIDEHRHLLKPPVGAEVIWKDSQFMVMLIGGPNARRDFHIDPRDEFFYQLEGDMILELIDERGKRQREKIREGDVLLLPANTPHSACSPATRRRWHARSRSPTAAASRSRSWPTSIRPRSRSLA